MKNVRKADGRKLTVLEMSKCKQERDTHDSSPTKELTVPCESVHIPRTYHIYILMGFDVLEQHCVKWKINDTWFSNFWIKQNLKSVVCLCMQALRFNTQFLAVTDACVLPI